jgi:tRNA-specific 2-thiouridylase
LTKKEVRALAEEANLLTAKKKDSTGICFIGKRDFKKFLIQFIPNQPGNFETLQGEIVGKHDGIAYYTIGQRRGLGIGGAGEAWYVVGKEIQRNVILVERGETHPALFSDSLTVSNVTWVGQPPDFPLRCTAKIRYRAPDVPCTVFLNEHKECVVLFDTPQKAITPRQSIVFYHDCLCLGVGIINL